MNSSELKQLKVALNIFREQPDRLEGLFRDGKLRLCSDAMYILYLHYLSNISFDDIYYHRGYACAVNEYQKEIAKLFMNISLEKKKATLK